MDQQLKVLIEVKRDMLMGNVIGNIFENSELLEA